MRRSSILLVFCLPLVSASCSGSTASPSTTARSESTDSTEQVVVVDTTTAPLIEAPFVVSPGTEQVTITGADPGLTMALYDDTDTELIRGTADETGSLVFRHLAGGLTVTVGDAVFRSDPVTTFARDEHPDAEFYSSQVLPSDGLGYITTRDGTTLSASVWLPGPAADGPYPTVVEYSGYSPSDPESSGFPDIFVALGYAYVGVNMRGTGCSGGSFRYFEFAQSLDGYDAIEAIASQPWVLDNEVGMVGVSYSGISQLFVAQTQPPSLNAITPFSVLDDSYQATLYPGGILNTGFAVEWAQERSDEAQPGGQPWTTDRIAGGDSECESNQGLRLQNQDLITEIRANEFWSDDPGAEIAPRLFVDKITVPTFVAGAWQDEQTGGHFPTMLDKFTGTEHLFVTLMNGLHTESISPAAFPRFVEFLDIYVAKRTPSLAIARFVAPQLASAIFGTTDVALPATDRFAGMTYADTRAEFESEPAIRVLFEQGAAEGYADRSPMARWQSEFSAWPVPEAEATTWLLGAGNSLATRANSGTGSTSYTADPNATPATYYNGSSSGIWSVDVSYSWAEGAANTFASFSTAPLSKDVVVVGSGSVDLWITSSVGDTDLEVTLTEVRPDGQEMYVQSGWLRASHRKLDAASSSTLRPVHTHARSDSAQLRSGVPELVRVELFPFAHAFRAGSRIRLIVDAPGGNRAVWQFETIANGELVTISHTDVAASQLVLPVVPGIDVPREYPMCGALRGQPCRATSAL